MWSLPVRKQQSVVGLISLAGDIDETTALSLLLTLRALPSRRCRIAALILRVSSNGGALGAAQAVHEGLQTLRHELGVPSVSLVTQTALSAGFYTALGADHVIATPAATLGNVGAAIRAFSPHRLFEKLGVEYLPIASGDAKDSLSNLGSLTTPQRALLQSVVDECCDQFAAMLRVRRPGLTEAAIASLRGGRVFTGAAAHSMGMVDHLGGLFRAIELCGELAGLAAPGVEVMDTAQPPGSGGVAGLVRRQALKTLEGMLTR
jgi:protease-4